MKVSPVSQPSINDKNSFMDKKIGQYVINELIGKGGMGKVYRGRDTMLNRDVAIKILPTDHAQDSTLAERFFREASTVASLDHQNIITIYNFDVQNDLRYIVMRFVQGETLRDIISRDGPLAPKRILEIVRQLSEALDYAHVKGVIHRDIKPSNIMVGHNDYVTLMDFGISKAFKSNQTTLTRHDQLVGTPEYMAPEQFTGGAITECSDTYSLSVVIYEMLTGNVPFTGDTPFAISHGHVYEPPPPPRKTNPHISSEVEHIILTGLAKRPEERYQTASELYADLVFAITGTAITRGKEKFKLVLADGTEHPLNSGVMRLGRARENDIMINDNLVSRHHAEIRNDAEGIVITDLGSANGTFVNGQKLTPHVARQLTAESEICLGTKICIRIKRDDFS